MSDEVVLGSTIKKLRVKLTPHSPFASSISRKDGVVWASAPVLTFADNSTWTATLSGTVASFGETQAEVDRVLALESRNVRLTLGTKVLARGQVERV